MTILSETSLVIKPESDVCKTSKIVAVSLSRCETVAMSWTVATLESILYFDYMNVHC